MRVHEPPPSLALMFLSPFLHLAKRTSHTIRYHTKSKYGNTEGNQDQSPCDCVPFFLTIMMEDPNKEVRAIIFIGSYCAWILAFLLIVVVQGEVNDPPVTWFEAPDDSGVNCYYGHNGLLDIDYEYRLAMSPGRDFDPVLPPTDDGTVYYGECGGDCSIITPQGCRCTHKGTPCTEHSTTTHSCDDDDIVKDPTCSSIMKTIPFDVSCPPNTCYVLSLSDGFLTCSDDVETSLPVDAIMGCTDFDRIHKGDQLLPQPSPSPTPKKEEAPFQPSPGEISADDDPSPSGDGEATSVPLPAPKPDETTTSAAWTLTETRESRMEKGMLFFLVLVLL